MVFWCRWDIKELLSVYIYIIIHIYILIVKNKNIYIYINHIDIDIYIHIDVAKFPAVSMVSTSFFRVAWWQTWYMPTLRTSAERRTLPGFARFSY